MIRRRWVANCDHPGCSEVVVLEGDQYDGKWALGEQITDQGWTASPAADPTYCPEHGPQHEAATSSNESEDRHG